ncbi:TonB-dependent receptor [Novosphingobium mangrovi (ex Huang et al. 2023)]|uniref:TonB-dependent receptor n=1 Tax=Novosphingobium mangrovi (ex Huang et al. 2023) TaxID=2976432 RepID=A0ABT2I1P8_9SPHN|nr:TonB-dependent receptor [Novosphingobium mangrovi (ex Huang et al. 2023)]MCT2398726.1 TonB-dependent receptor [Novosphingobium mangrovi (ex Huang et al. 2023)]
MKLNSASRLLRATALAGVAAAAFTHAQMACAEDAAGADAEPDDAIVVTGSILASQQASVEAKRKAINMTDIASADAAARFPDQSAAGALARLPGVAVQRDQGQERYIQVRGAPNRWTSVSIDGVPMVGVDEGGDTRAFRFDAIPAVMLSEMVINKSLTSNLQADAIVATIDLKTYSPLDRLGFHVDGDVGYGLMGHGGGQQRQGSLRVSWSNDSFGIVLGGSHYLRDQITDNREPGYDDTGEPTTFSVRSYKLERYNNGLFGGIEWSPEEGQKLYAKVIWSEFADNEERNQYDFAVSGDTVTGISGMFNDGKYRNRNTIGLIGGDYDDFNGFTASFKANYAKTVNTTDLPLVRSSMSTVGDMTYTLDDPRFPIFSDNDGSFSQTNLSQAGTILLPLEQRTESDSYTVKFDMAKELGDLTLSAGLLYADRDIAGNVMSTSSYAAIGYVGSLIGQPFNVNDYVTSTGWDTDYPLGLSLNYVDNKAMRRGAEATLAAMEAAGLFDPAGVIEDTTRYNQREKTLAGYLMGTFVKGPLTVAGGVRIENYSMDNAGWLNIEGDYTPKAYSASKTDFFPSLNIRYEASNDIVLRLAGQRGVSRPAYGATRVGASVNDTSKTIEGGNPLLKPEYTWGVDTSVEWYLPGNGIISVGAFYRWVDNVLYSAQERVNSDFYDTPGFDTRADYLFSGQYNGKSGKLYGVEFNVQKQFDFLPGALSGFGLQGNLTLLDGDFEAPDKNGVLQTYDFQGMSRTIANASLFYEKYGLSARVSYQWRSHWLDTLGGLGSGEYRAAYENLDVTLRYAVTDDFTLYADLANLTNETYVAYADSLSHPTEVERIGARYLFGVRFSY